MGLRSNWLEYYSYRIGGDRYDRNIIRISNNSEMSALRHKQLNNSNWPNRENINYLLRSRNTRPHRRG
jgi:hypothetical protein